MKHTFNPGIERGDRISISRYISEKKELIIEIITMILMVILAYAAINKLLSYKSYQFELSLTPTFKSLIAPITWIVPCTELLIVILLLIRTTKIIALYFSLVLFSVYLIAMFQLKFYVPSIRGGILDKLTYSQYAVINSVMLILSLTAILIFYNLRHSK